MARLIPVNATGDMAALDLAPRAFQLGRAPDNDLVLSPSEVSRHHAVIDFDDGLFWVEDLRSRHGVRVNSQRISEPVSLMDGDRISFASVDLRFVGDPDCFRPSAIDGSWVSRRVFDLASTIRAERCFERLPSLADALNSAGCHRREILGHCRAGSRHTRGCWVVEMILKSVAGSPALRWLHGNDPLAMLELLRNPLARRVGLSRTPSARKLCLVALAFCRDECVTKLDPESTLDQQSWNALAVFERFVDGLASRQELFEAAAEAEDAANSSDADSLSEDLAGAIAREGARRRIAEVIALAAIPAGSYEVLLGETANILRATMNIDFRRKEIGYLCCIFGNPFFAVPFNPRWLTPPVVELALAVDRERAFEKLPILADALMDAGCEGQEILEHCRVESPHVRGCWVVDLLLQKE